MRGGLMGTNLMELGREQQKDMGHFADDYACDGRVLLEGGEQGERKAVKGFFYGAEESATRRWGGDAGDFGVSHAADCDALGTV